MKVCTYCKVEKQLKYFDKSKIRKDGHTTACKKCQREYAKIHYSKNKEKRIAQTNEWRDTKKVKTYKFIFDYLLLHPCVDCKESDPIVLEFDHLNPATKTASVRS